MNKYLKLSFIFTGLWILVLFAVLPLYFSFFDVIPAAFSAYLPLLETIWEWSFYALFYGVFLILGLAILTGIMASRQTIKVKSKSASVALILTSANALYLFGTIYAGWPF